MLNLIDCDWIISNCSHRINFIPLQVYIICSFFKLQFLFFLFSFFNCCSSTVFYLFLQPLPTTPAFPTFLPCFHHPPLLCPSVLYNCFCKSSSPRLDHYGFDSGMCDLKMVISPIPELAVEHQGRRGKISSSLPRSSRSARRSQ